MGIPNFINLYSLWMIYYNCHVSIQLFSHYSPTFIHIIGKFTSLWKIPCCVSPQISPNLKTMPSIFTTSSGAKRKRSLASSFNTCLGCRVGRDQACKGSPKSNKLKNHHPKTLFSLNSQKCLNITLGRMFLLLEQWMSEKVICEGTAPTAASKSQKARILRDYRRSYPYKVKTPNQTRYCWFPCLQCKRPPESLWLSREFAGV